MIIDSSKLVKGQKLRINLDKVLDRLPNELIESLKDDPVGILVGFKMVDGNAFGLVLELSNGKRAWFFDNELSEEIML
tara:strand:+ start:3326 stop:3559 length:234 start_codon:yes stop_codon:yes gene_type:complete